MQTINKFNLLLLLFILKAEASFTQTVSTFEFPSVPGGYWDGVDQSGGFSSGNCFFPNAYDTSFGGYWDEGFAWSTQSDTITPGFSSLFSCRAGSGYQSAGYAIAQNHAVFHLTGSAAGKSLTEVKVCNSTFAYYSMLQGDGFAKKFGGPSGNDPDFFKLTFIGFENGILKSDSIEFYLADYRFSNNALDYIHKSWQNVSLASLGNCDSVFMRLTSSDNGMFGINTPAFVCLDQLITSDVFQSHTESIDTDLIRISNPGNNMQTLHFKSGNCNRACLSIWNSSGALVYRAWIQEGECVDLSKLPEGLYPASLQVQNKQITCTLLKSN